MLIFFFALHIYLTSIFTYHVNNDIVTLGDDMNKETLNKIYRDALKDHWNNSEIRNFVDAQTLVNCVNYVDTINLVLDKANLQIVPLTNDGYDEPTKSIIIRLADKNDISRILGKIILCYDGISISYTDTNDLSECISNINYNGITTAGAISRLAGPDNFVCINFSGNQYSVSGSDKKYSYAAEKNEERIAELYNALEVASDVKLKYIGR